MSIVKKDNVNVDTVTSVALSLKKYYEKMKDDEIGEILAGKGANKIKQVKQIKKRWEQTFEKNPIFNAANCIEAISNNRLDEMKLEELCDVIKETGNKNVRKIVGSALDKKRSNILNKHFEARNIIDNIESPNGKDIPVIEDTTTIQNDPAFKITDTSLAPQNRDGYRKLFDTALANEMKIPTKDFSNKELGEKEENKTPSRMEAVEMFFNSDVMNDHIENLRLADPKKAKKFIKKQQKETKTIGKLKTMDATVEKRDALEQKIQQALEMLSNCSGIIPSNKLEKAKKDLEKQYSTLVKQNSKDTKTINKIVEKDNLQESIENGKTYLEVTKELETLRPAEDIENEIYKIDNRLETLTDPTRVQAVNERKEHVIKVQETSQKRRGELNAILNGMVTSHMAHITNEPIYNFMLNEPEPIEKKDITNALSKDTKSSDEIAKYDKENTTKSEKQVEIEQEEI